MYVVATVELKFAQNFKKVIFFWKKLVEMIKKLDDIQNYFSILKKNNTRDRILKKIKTAL